MKEALGMESWCGSVLERKPRSPGLLLLVEILLENAFVFGWFPDRPFKCQVSKRTCKISYMQYLFSGST